MHYFHFLFFSLINLTIISHFPFFIFDFYQSFTKMFDYYLWKPRAANIA